MAITGPFYWNKTGGTFPSQGGVPVLIGSDAFAECCCVEPFIPCGNCLEGTTPAQLEITVASITPYLEICGDGCYDFNGTFILSKVLEDDCDYEYAFAENPCPLSDRFSSFRWRVLLSATGVMAQLIAYDAYTSMDAALGTWTASASGDIPGDCSEVEYTATTSQLPDWCTWAASTVYVINL